MNIKQFTEEWQTTSRVSQQKCYCISQSESLGLPRNLASILWRSKLGTPSSSLMWHTSVSLCGIAKLHGIPVIVQFQGNPKTPLGQRSSAAAEKGKLFVKGNSWVLSQLDVIPILGFFFGTTIISIEYVKSCLKSVWSHVRTKCTLMRRAHCILS